MTEISNKTYGEERALYGLKDATVKNCVFAGKEDGESALKESRSIIVSDCDFELRYPLWHCTDVEIGGCTFKDTCRASLWYTKDGLIENCTVDGVKCLRECESLVIKNCKFNSAEFGWCCSNLRLGNCEITSEYPFFRSERLRIDNMKLCGKYSFQYVTNAVIENSVLDTKDAFWHAKNVTVRNCVINGEYLGWYSKKLTLENCTIKGTQPLCYCNELKLVNCTMIDTDLAFECSNVEADIVGNVMSVKNPRFGRIVADSYGEVILKDCVYPCQCRVETRNIAI